jgi:hypothetical protein
MSAADDRRNLFVARALWLLPSPGISRAFELVAPGIAWIWTWPGSEMGSRHGVTGPGNPFLNVFHRGSSGHGTERRQKRRSCRITMRLSRAKHGRDGLPGENKGHGPGRKVTPPARDGVRALGSRETADAFATTLEAYAAIAELPSEVRPASAAFLVESIRDSPKTTGDRLQRRAVSCRVLGVAHPLSGHRSSRLATRNGVVPFVGCRS